MYVCPVTHRHSKGTKLGLHPRLLKHHEQYFFISPLYLRGTRRRSGAVRKRYKHTRVKEKKLSTGSEVEYKCGMFMVLPFYFILVPAKH